MKKFFFFAAALLSSAAMMAEVYTVNQENYPTEAEAKAGADKTAVAAGDVLYTGTAFDVKNPFATTYQRVGLSANDYKILKFAGAEVIVVDQWGIQGNDNPKDANGGNPATTLLEPTQGAAYQVDAKADGFIYVFHKASSNKHYFAFEVYGGEAAAWGYESNMITCPAGKEALKAKTASLAGIMCSDIIKDSLIAYAPEVDGDNYVEAAMVFPEIPNLKMEDAWYTNLSAEDKTSISKNGAYALNGLGVMKFPVEANTTYLFGAAGSKMSLAAVAFSQNGDEQVSVSNGTNEIILTLGAPTGLKSNAAAVKATKAIKNGQLVLTVGEKKFNVLGAEL